MGTLHLSNRIDGSGCYYGHYETGKRRRSIDIAVPRTERLPHGSNYSRQADDTKWKVYIDGQGVTLSDSLESAKEFIEKTLGK